MKKVTETYLRSNNQSLTYTFTNHLRDALIDANYDGWRLSDDLRIESFTDMNTMEEVMSFHWRGGSHRMHVRLPQNAEKYDKQWNETIEELVAWLLLTKPRGHAAS